MILEMKRLIVLVVAVAMLAVLAATPASDTSASRADSSIPENETTTSRGEEGNASASAGITITMYAVDDG